MSKIISNETPSEMLYRFYKKYKTIKDKTRKRKKKKW